MTATERESRLTWRLRLAACCAVLMAMSFLQQPGRIVGDTKLDLVVDPAGFLGRALTLWDPNGAFGQVQNQAYGYLFPMGPFFLLGKLAAVEPWVVQRLWWTLVLCLAFLGMVRLCSALRVGAPWARILAGFAFALSPRMISVIGPSSVEVWPSALAPWVLIPLVHGMRRGDPRRQAALSALAVAAVGGVNAAATAAVLPLGAIWLLTRRASPRRRALMVWWPALTALGTLWWLVPLFLLGSYSPPFLDYIESASTTTFAGTVVDGLRGTTNWVSYISNDLGSGRALIGNAAVIANSVVVLTLGIVGVATRGTRHRTFLVTSLLVGLALVTLGHVDAVDGLFSERIQTLLDGALAPLRNTHKFDVIVRIPLVIGLALLVSRRRTSGAPAATGGRRAVAYVACAALVGAAVPVWTARLAPDGSFVSVPDYWHQASGWLADHQGRSLLVPGSSFGDYLWGNPRDEPLQPLATSPWAVRNSIPLAPGGNIAMLDAVQARLASGRGTAGLSSFLRRSGVTYLVLRNDLTREAALNPEVVRSTLATTPGVRRVRSFGPEVGGGPTLRTKSGRQVFVDEGIQTVRRAVEIYRVGRVPVPVAQTQDLATTPVVVGDPAAILGLSDLGMSTQAGVLLAGDVPSDVAPRQVVLTDSQRRDEVSFGRVDGNRSASMTRDAPYRQERPQHVYRLAGGTRWDAVRRLDGAKQISASSSQSDADTFGGIRPDQQPWSAFDDDPSTSWVASAGEAGKPAWIEITFEAPRPVRDVTVTTGRQTSPGRSIEVRTDHQRRQVEVGRGPTRVALGEGQTTTLRLTSTSSGESPFTLADVQVPGLTLSRPLVLPRVPRSWGGVDRMVLSATEGYRAGCLLVDGTTRCSAGAAHEGDDGRRLDRVFSLPRRQSYPMDLTARGISGPGLDELVQKDDLLQVTGSSQLTDSPLASARLATDGVGNSGWVASVDDEDPTLRLRWVGTRRLSSIRVANDTSLAASRPTGATLVFGDDSTQRVTFVRGRARFRPVRTGSVEVHLRTDKPARNLNTDGTGGELPIGVSEVRLPGTELLPRPVEVTVRDYGCGSGPRLTLDGRTTPTALRASPRQLLDDDDIAVRRCGPRNADLASGSHRLTATPTGAVRLARVVLGGTSPLANAAPRPTTVLGWGPTQRVVREEPSPGASVLATSENANAGWHANRGELSRRPIVLDGWRQAWTGPASATTNQTRLVYTPNRLYRASLLIGLLLLTSLALVAALRRRHAFAPENAAPGRTGPLVAATVAVLALLISGPWVLAGIVGLVVGLVLGPQRRTVAGWFGGLLVLVAGSAYVVRPWGSPVGWAGDLAWPQVLVVAALGLLVSTLGSPSLSRRSFRRTAGRSTAQ